ncbi:hypothetical protein DBR47_03490 [Paucibacter sp. KBW04]|uniref:flagellar biosynthetic protein FliO n=1 Tax=Paucibacter sp. KBW04 TaxID=2153361 RepID=UPI000F56F869|nr:flagellar biosynthetic protein FliO [Paucibacter sp. KBW04]RQO63601.1 hypothetical protein DBR47_03490 [Paucibacter sp. KBW04]
MSFHLIFAWGLDLFAIALSDGVGAGGGGQSIPFRVAPELNGESLSLWQVGLICIVALVVCILVLRFLIDRRLWVKNTPNAVVVVERTVLNPNTQLLVVDYGSRRLLLAVGSTGVNCLRDDEKDGCDQEDSVK